MQNNPQAPTSIFQRLVDNAYLFLTGAVSLFLITMWLLCLDANRFNGLMVQNGNMFIDFCKVYGLSKMVYAGQGVLIYEPAAQKAFLHNLVPPHSFEAFVFLPYPPFVYALFGPFAALPMVPAYGAWLGFTLVVGLTGLLYLRMQSMKCDTLTDRLALFALALSSVFFFNTIFLGQAAWLITGLACVFFASLMRKNDTICGIALGLCTIKFQFLLLLGTPLLVLRRWRAIMIGGLISLLFVSFAFVSIGAKNVLNYPAILNVQEILHPNIPLMINLRGFLFTISPQTDHSNAVGSGLIAAAVILSLWLSARSIEQKWKAIGLSTIAYLIFSPHAFVYDGLLLTIPAAITLKRVSLYSACVTSDFILKTRSVILCLLPVIGWIAYFRGNEYLGRTMLIINLLLLVLGIFDYVGTFAIRKTTRATLNLQ